MVDVVVDASALAAFVFHEPKRLDMLERFEGVTLRAPQLLDYEMANIYVIKQRRQGRKDRCKWKPRTAR